MNKNKKSKFDYSTIKLVGDKFVAPASNVVADGALTKCKKPKTTTAVKKTRTKA
jgi:hypothetical protein